MTDYSTRQLDAGLTALALRGRHDRAGHWVAVREWEARRRRAGLLADAVFGAVVLGLAVGAWWLALAVVSRWP